MTAAGTLRTRSSSIVVAAASSSCSPSTAGDAGGLESPKVAVINVKIDGKTSPCRVARQKSILDIDLISEPIDLLTSLAPFPHLISQIFLFLEPKDLCALYCTSRSFKNIVLSDPCGNRRRISYVKELIAIKKEVGHENWPIKRKSSTENRLEHRDVFSDVKNTKVDQPRRINGSSNLDERSIFMRPSSCNNENNEVTPCETSKRSKRDHQPGCNRANSSKVARRLILDKEGSKSEGGISDSKSVDHNNVENDDKKCEQGSTPKKPKLKKVDSAGSKASIKRLKRL